MRVFSACIPPLDWLQPETTIKSWKRFKKMLLVAVIHSGVFFPHWTVRRRSLGTVSGGTLYNYTGLVAQHCVFMWIRLAGKHRNAIYVGIFSFYCTIYFSQSIADSSLDNLPVKKAPLRSVSALLLHTWLWFWFFRAGWNATVLTFS